MRDENHRFDMPSSPWTYENGDLNPALLPSGSRSRVTSMTKRRRAGVANVPPYHPDYRPPGDDSAFSDSASYAHATDEDDEAALQRALRASVSEASRSGATEEEQRMLEETLKKSLLDTHNRRKGNGKNKEHGSDSEWDSDTDTEDDDDFQPIGPAIGGVDSYVLPDYIAETPRLRLPQKARDDSSPAHRVGAASSR